MFLIGSFICLLYFCIRKYRSKSLVRSFFRSPEFFRTAVMSKSEIEQVQLFADRFRQGYFLITYCYTVVVRNIKSYPIGKNDLIQQWLS